MPRLCRMAADALSAYVIWRRVPPLRRPGKRSAAGQYTRHRAALCRVYCPALCRVVPDGG
ncbi:hypothetical protein CWN40_03495 [Klebsiella quasipneumoniae]|nr:hypothetical protein CWN69_21015 [Klebsiella quasipneumoniae]PLM39291.1 hypothetical protein CWN40_03495 [Klebsiella quasipneumoniae]